MSANSSEKCRESWAQSAVIQSLGPGKSSRQAVTSENQNAGGTSSNCPTINQADALNSRNAFMVMRRPAAMVPHRWARSTYLRSGASQESCPLARADV
eukprot:2621059-Pyramimonas_sp.AAC.1